MGLEGKDLVKRDLKRKVKGLVIPHKIDFSNKKIKRWKGPEKNDEDLVKKNMKKRRNRGHEGRWKRNEEQKIHGKERSKGKVEDMIIFHLEQESEKSAPPITNQYNFARDVRAMFVFWNSPCNNIICSDLKVRIWKVVLDVILLQKWSSSLIGSA